MKKKRLIPVLLLKDGFLVQSREFRKFQILGNPMTAVKRMSEWGTSELIYLDITRDSRYDQRRDDLRHPNHDNVLSILDEVARLCHMPTTFGGGIKNTEDIHDRLERGADKISTNTKALEDPSFIGTAARRFGSQCIILSMDVKTVDGRYTVMKNGGSEPTPYDPVEWARMAESGGAGEILLNSVDRDGTRQGFDIELINAVADNVRIPVIALGGAGCVEHFSEVLDKTNADGVAAANFFHYFDQSVYLVKKELCEKGYNVRVPDLFSL